MFAAKMRSIRCSPCKCVFVFKLFYRCWMKILLVFLLTVTCIFMTVENDNATSHLEFLLKYDFAELTVSPDKFGSRDISKCYRRSSHPEYSSWFRERFRANIKLFLDKHDADNIRNLSHYILPFGFLYENHPKIRFLLQHNNFKNPPLDLRKIKDCIDCAVVGSGGNLKGSQAGAEINSYDYVFRANRAVRDGGYAKDVGTKTDFYIFYPESEYVEYVQDQNVTYLFTMYKSYDVDFAAKLLNIPRRKLWKDVDPGKVKIVHPDFFRYIYARYLEGKSLRPTTGAVMALLAVHMCDTVTLYGFGYDSRFTLHYYDEKFKAHSWWSTRVHDVDRERRLWEKLHNESVIRLFKRDTM